MAGMTVVPHRADRILGCGVLLSGAVLLGIGLILGLEFPRYVVYQKMKESCVTGADTQHYRDWLAGYNSSTLSIVVIWPHHLHDKTPDEEGPGKGAGPYAFVSQARKVDVRSTNGLLAYRVFSQHRFDEEETRRLCPTCHDHDEVTVANTVRQQMLAPFGSAAHYLRRHVARMAGALRHSWSARHLPPPGSAAPSGPLSAISQLTCRMVRLDTSLLRLGPPRRLLPALRLLEEPQGLRRAPLRLGVCLAAWRRLLRDARLPEHACTTYRRGQARHCDAGFFLEQLRRLNASERERAGGATLELIGCHANVSLPPSNRESTSAMLSLLSFLLPRLHEAVSVASVLNLQGTSLRGPVSQVSLGFRLQTVLFTKNSVSCWHLPAHAVLEDVWVGGALDHQESEPQARRRAAQHVLTTCLFNRSKESNLLWKDRVTPSGGRTSEASGFSSALPPASELSACSRPATTPVRAAIYESHAWRPLTYVSSGRTPALGHVRLVEYVAPGANATVYNLANVTDFSQWVRLGPIGYMRKSLVNFSPKVLVEPLSGHIWSRDVTWTSYVGDTEAALTPLWTVTQHWQVSDGVIARHRWQSIALLEVGCVGLVVCSLFGGLIVLAGYLVFLGVITCRSSAVAPLLAAH